MKQWLIPAIVLLAVGGLGLGVGWSVNEWQNGDGTSAPLQAGPTQAEREREDVRLCLEAQQAAGAQEAAHDARQAAIERGDITGRRSRGPGVDISVLEAIDRYCH